MPDVILDAELGRPLGSASARRLRASGKIPGVVYGHGTEPVPVAVDARAFRVAMSGEAGMNQLLSLRSADQTLLTLARDLQRHPVKGTVTHVDFQIVRRDEVIAAEVPVVLTGEAIQVHRGDGLVDQLLFSITVHARPADIPSSIEVDIDDLEIGGAVRMADITLPRGVTVDLEDDAAIVMGQPPRVQAGAEGEEGAEAGEAPERAGAQPSEEAGQAPDGEG
jgi:large subunit ribosomal protein L25